MDRRRVAVVLTGVGKRYDIVSAFSEHATTIAVDPSPLAPARYAADVEREEPEAWAAWRRGGADFRFPEGESLAEHQERVLAGLDAVRAGPEPALVVSHGGTIRAIAAARHPRGLDAFHELDVPNAALIDLDDPGRWIDGA